MFFGSAITNGVTVFKPLSGLHAAATPRESDETSSSPSGKVHGLCSKSKPLEPAHRDRLVTVRVVSGEFRRDMSAWHLGPGKQIQLKAPQQFMADERAMVETAYPGDIIGLFDPGIYRLGDTLSETTKLRFDKIPIFAPEHFARVRPLDSMKRKQFLKGIAQLSEEGAIQTFTRDELGLEQSIIGVVGVLQFDVLSYRLKNEYGAELTMDNLPWRYVRWVIDSPKEIDDLSLTSTTHRGRDSQDHPVLFFENEWSIRLAEKNPRARAERHRTGGRNRGLNELPPSASQSPGV